MIEIIHVTDMFRVAALRQAQRKEQIIDVVNDDGEIVQGHVRDVESMNPFMWRVQLERLP